VTWQLQKLGEQVTLKLEQLFCQLLCSQQLLLQL